MDNKKLLGQRIKTLRKVKGYTQEQLAEEIGIETNSLSAIESGRHFPSLVTLEKISQQLDLHLHAFFEFKDEVTIAKMKEKITQSIEYMGPDEIFGLYQASEHYKNIL